MSSTLLNLPTKACHNCRKRRWRCDRSLPSCQKCLSAGTECLGYGKLFVWNQGVASRGKMMGKGYEERMEREREIHGNSSGEMMRDRVAGEQQQRSAAGKRDAKAHSMPTPLVWNVESVEHHQQQHQQHRHDASPSPSSLSSPGTADDEVDSPHVRHHHHQHHDDRHQRQVAVTTLHHALVDPLVRDLDDTSRYYLDHFSTQLCNLMVVNDVPGQNPLRELLTTINAYPLLRQIIIANSATHVHNLSRKPLAQPGLQGHHLSPLTGNHDPKDSKSLQHALVAKQQALTLLAQNIASVNEHNIDFILMTILMFVNYALVDSGVDKWKIHMAGAFRLISLLGQPPYLQTPMSKLRQTILSDFLVFYILGSTFSFATIPLRIPDTIDLDPILTYAETNNYLSCPKPLLWIMLQSFRLEDPSRYALGSEEHIAIQDQVGELLKQALAFDPEVWIREFIPATANEDMEKRLCIARAHRSGVCIYLARILPTTNPLLDESSPQNLISLTNLADDVVKHIRHMRPGDPLFKSTCWPLFLAGAESRDPSQRVWILGTLDELYTVIHWGYLQTSKEILGNIWYIQDNAAPDADKCWVEELKEMVGDILIA